MYFVDIPLDDMQRSYSTLYVRHEFAVGDLEDVSSLLLHVDYDDAFVAYINGTEVARSDFGVVGNPVPYDGTVRTTSRESSFREVFKVELEAFPSLLSKDQNVLAIQGINRSTNDRDFVLAQLRLSAVTVPEPTALLPIVSTILALGILRKRRLHTADQFATFKTTVAS